MADASRYPKISGQFCIHPLIADTSTRDGTPSPGGLASSISCPLGRYPGSAFFTMSREAGDALGKNDAHTITWHNEVEAITFQGYYIVKQSLINVDGDTNAAYLVELADKRIVLGMAGINKRYNVLKPLPYTLDDTTQATEKYFTDSLSGGTSLHTWTSLWSNLWTYLPASVAGTAPTLPYSPAGTPKNFSFSENAMDAVAEFLTAIVCTLKYDPLTGEFSVVQLSQVQDGLAASMTALEPQRMFDSKDREGCNAANVPANHVILSPKQWPDNDDHSDPGTEDTAATGASGAIGGTNEVVWQRHANTYCDIGGIQNTAEIAARAAELGQELGGMVGNQTTRLIIYSGLVWQILPGAQVTEVVWRDFGDEGDQGGLKTEVMLERFDLPHPPRRNIEVEKIIRCRLDDVLWTGMSAPATVVVYDDPNDWLPDNCTLTVWDSLDMAPPDTGLLKNLEIWVKWNYDSEKWEVLSLVENKLVFFQLYQDKSLTSQPVVAQILSFDGTDWVPSGLFFDLYDSYYNSPGFFTGKANIDRGWAKLRKKAEEEEDLDQYELIWMSGPWHEIQFELTADRDIAAPSELLGVTVIKGYRYGNFSRSPSSVRFPEDYFPRAQSGAKGTAQWDDTELEYVVVQCDQLSPVCLGYLGQDMCGATASVTGVVPARFWPTGQEPIAFGGISGGGGTAFNYFNHAGLAGDLVELSYDTFFDLFYISDVAKHEIELAGPMIDNGTTICQKVWKARIEICEDYTNNCLATEECESGSGSGS